MAYATGCLFFAGALFYLVHFVFEHTDYLVAHGFLACRAEIDVDFVCGLSYALHKVRLFGFRRRGSCFFAIHIVVLSSALAPVEK